MQTTCERTISEIAAAKPSSIRGFESLGIDYCCVGKRSLADACTRAGLSLDRTLALLEEADAAPTAERDWADAPLPELGTHIVEAHHSYVRREIPRIDSLLAKVVNRHGCNHSEVLQIQPLFSALGQELTAHMMKEELVLFLYITRMAAGSAGFRENCCFGTVANPIANMVAEHEDAGALLVEMRRLSSNYQVPEDGCPTFRALYQAIEEFERDLHQHIHLENNILFPRAIAMERGY